VSGVGVPACETLRPASSISWSMEKAPVDMSSWSSAAALLAERVCGGSLVYVHGTARNDILEEPC
jgi:hypothetical protein